MMRLRPFSLFSLVELLVVLAILALLMAFALPTLKNFHHQAMNLNCQSHLARLHGAKVFYAEDHRDVIMPYHLNNRYWASTTSNFGLHPYFNAQAPEFFCPSSPLAPFPLMGATTYAINANGYTSPGIPNSYGYALKRFSRIKFPARLVSFVDAPEVDYAPGQSYGICISGLYSGTWHDTGCNFSSFDGSAHHARIHERSGHGFDLDGVHHDFEDEGLMP